MNAPLLPLDRGPRDRRARTATGLVLAAMVLVVGFAAMLARGAPSASAGEGARKPETAGASWTWTPEMLRLAARIPVQDGGRVKPLQTYASYTLLGLDHRRSSVDADGESLSSLAWLLEVTLRPERARRAPCFLVETAEVLDAIGLEHEGKKKRDHYAYADLLPARARLSELAGQYMAIESNRRSAVEDGIVALDRAVDAFERLSSLLAFARAELDVGDGPAVAALFPGRARVGVLDVVAHLDDLARIAGPVDPHAAAGPSDERGSPDRRAALALRGALRTLAEDAVGLTLIPPPDSKKQEPTWFAPGHVLFTAAEGQELPGRWGDLLGRLCAMQAAVTRGEATAFTDELRAYQASAEAMARARGEYEKVPLEVFLGDLDPFHRGVHLYLLAFLVVALGWLASSRWQRRAAWALLLAVLALHVAGIVIRCVLRERPPISTLYETVLFVSALGVGACLVAERIDRRGIALALAPVLGWLGLFVANRFEALKGEDTMPQLVAVLDTNFWLATHVTCIAIGYSGGLLASAIAHVTVLGRAFGLKRDDEAFHRAVSRMTYGMLCFGLLFSVVGTILGGIWANESWGRFWGWDPKENGALMICLVQIAILHGRLGGYLKATGIALATIAAGCVVAFSWWHVNLLGIGLHSYGFSGGVLTGLLAFYGAEAAVLLVGIGDLVRRRLGAAKAA